MLSPIIKPLYIYVSRIGPISGHMTDNCNVSFDNSKHSPCEVNNSIVTLDNPTFSPVGGDNRKSSVCEENMATEGRFGANSEKEIANIHSEKDAENTKRSMKFTVNCCHISITFCPLSILVFVVI